MPHPEVTGDPAGREHAQELRGTDGRDADLLGDALGAGEAEQAFDAAQRRLLGGAHGDGDAVGADPGLDLLESDVVVEVPADGDDVLGGPAPQQEAALVVVEAEAHQVAGEVVVVHADGVGAEPAPVGEPLRLDDQVTQVHGAEDVGLGGHRRPARKSVHRPLNSSARSHCTQCPVFATVYRSQLGMRSASIRPPEGRLTLSAAPHSTRVGTGRRRRRRSRLAVRTGRRGPVLRQRTGQRRRRRHPRGRRPGQRGSALPPPGTGPRPGRRPASVPGTAAAVPTACRCPRLLQAGPARHRLSGSSGGPVNRQGTLGHGFPWTAVRVQRAA